MGIGLKPASEVIVTHKACGNWLPVVKGLFQVCQGLIYKSQTCCKFLIPKIKRSGDPGCQVGTVVRVQNELYYLS